MEAIIKSKIGNKYNYRLCDPIEETVEEYIDPSELGGIPGHYADENMISEGGDKDDYSI